MTSMMLQSAVQKKFDASQQLFREFVKQTPGVNQHAYGEIKFIKTDMESTFSPYVTVSTDVNMPKLCRIFATIWGLELPYVAVSTVGEFDYSQQLPQSNNFANSWVFTDGLIPHCYFMHSSLIAIMQAGSFKGFQTLRSDSTQGLFPAICRLSNDGDEGRTLNNQSDYFVFVEGNADEVDSFRLKLLNCIATMPLKFDSTYTSFKELPLFTALFNGTREEIYHAAQMLQYGHPVIISCVTDVSQLMRDVSHHLEHAAGRENEKSPWENKKIASKLDSILRLFANTDQKAEVETFLKSYPNDKLFFNHGSSNSLEIIKYLTSSDRYSIHDAGCLALIWNNLEIIKDLVKSKQFRKTVTLHATYLYKALLFNRTDFLDLLFEMNINIYPCLTTKDLWKLYYQSNINSKYFPFAARSVVKLLSRDNLNLRYLLFEVGLLITNLSEHECGNLYADQSYVYDGNNDNFTNQASNILHPERDIFLWAILMGKHDIAKVVWKHGNEHIFSALLASTICRKEARLHQNLSEYSLITAKFEEYTNSWNNIAITYLLQSYKTHQDVTLHQLVLKSQLYGESSPMIIAYRGHHEDFASQGPVQACSDVIWNGRIKLNLRKSLLGILIPFLIPHLGLLRQDPRLKTNTQSVTRSTFTYELNKNTQYESDSENTCAELSLKGGLKKWLEDAYYFYNTPAITFVTHTSFLILSIFLLAISLITMNIYKTYITYQIHTYWLFWYMVGNLGDEIRQLTGIRASTNLAKLKQWSRSGWNIVDLIMLISYFLGFGLMRSYRHDDSMWYAAKVLLCVTLSCLFIRALQTNQTSRVMGPILHMIAKMLQDMLIFGRLFFFFIIPYGIIYESLKYENMPTSDEIPSNGTSLQKFTFSNILFQSYNHLLLKPYWQIHGELLNEVTMPVTNGPEVIRTFLAAAFVAFSVFLMINLLIAMFSYTFENIREQSYRVWGFKRLGLIQEFSDRPWLSSPFILFVLLYRLIRHLVRPTSQCNPFELEIHEYKMKIINGIEKKVIKSFAYNELELDTNRLETRTTNTFASI